MMRVVYLSHEIRDRELQFMRPQPPRFAFRRQAVARAEKLQDIGSLADDEPPGLEKRRRKGRSFDVAAVEKAYERRYAGSFARLARHIPISRAGLLQRQAHEFTAALNRRPVVQFILHYPPRVSVYCRNADIGKLRYNG